MNEMLNSLKNILHTVMPKKWHKVILYAEISENSYDISFYCFIDGIKEPVQCYNLEKYGIKEAKIDQAFEKINEVLKPFWKEAEEKDKWTNCTFTLFDDDKFNFDLDNTDLINYCYEYREQWRQKYIN